MKPNAFRPAEHLRRPSDFKRVCAGMFSGLWITVILVVVFLSVLNIFGVRTGAAVQNVFTFAKTAALLGLVLLGLSIDEASDAAQVRQVMKQFSYPGALASAAKVSLRTVLNFA